MCMNCALGGNEGGRRGGERRGSRLSKIVQSYINLRKPPPLPLGP